MIRHPRPHVEDIVVYDDNGLTASYLTFNLPTAEDSSLPLCLRVHDRGVLGRRAHKDR